MQVIKNINNNVVICMDDYGRELVAFGKGLGFPAAPYELTDLSKVQRTFYNISPQYLTMLDAFPYDVLELTASIVDVAKGELSYALSPNLVLTLCDHISFALERKRKKIYIKLPLAYDVEHNYPQEMALARKAMRLIWRRLKVRLADDEASGIALAFVNARIYAEDEQENRVRTVDQQILNEITKIIENEMHTSISVSSCNYCRYATHVQYLLERLHSGKNIDSINSDLYSSIRSEYPDTAQCVDKIVQYLKRQHGFAVTEEEQLYLILHVNRVCTKEEL